MTMYKAEDFNLENAPKEMVQYVLDNVDDFESRYQYALSIIGRDRCPLQMADYTLFDDIRDAINEYSLDRCLDADAYDIEEIFG